MMRRTDPRILWLNLSGSFVTGLDLTCPIHVVACLDDGLDLDLIARRSQIVFLSEERQTRRRIEAHDGETDRILLSLHERIMAVIDTAPRAPWLLACPRPSAALESFARESGHRCISPPAKLCQWLNHKANFFAARAALDLPVSRGRWFERSSLRFLELRNALGLPFVLQAPRGTTGSGTAVVHRADELAEACERLHGSRIWCAPYLGNLSLNVNALATGFETMVSYPSVQLEGPLLQPIHRGKYCGNDFSATHMLETGIIEDAREQTRTLGGWLGSLGYRGLFGVDYVVDESTGKLVAVDLNPRWQGSTMLENLASCAAGRLPLAAADLLHASGLLSNHDLRHRADDFFLPLSGSQLILYALTSEPLTMEREVRPGLYHSVGHLQFERESLELEDGGEETLLGAAVPRAGTAIEPGARPARLFSHRASIDAMSGTVLPWVTPAFEAALELFGLSPNSETTSRAS